METAAQDLCLDCVGETATTWSAGYLGAAPQIWENNQDG